VEADIGMQTVKSFDCGTLYQEVMSTGDQITRKFQMIWARFIDVFSV